MIDEMPDKTNPLAAGARARSEGRLDDAFNAYQLAANALRGEGSQPQLISALSGLGRVERDRGARDAAAGYYAEALAVCRAHGDRLLTAHTARHLGDLYCELGRHGEAGALLRESVDIYRNSLETKVLDLANTLRPLALLLGATGDAERARELWLEARMLYAAINVGDGVVECDAQLHDE